MSDYKDLTIKVHGDVTIVVPDSLELVTSYVLREQEDWFEDEIKFVRELMQPGMRAIDIGANYGLYTLSMAKKIGTTGHIWAFEPASSTVSFLKRSIEVNRFNNITVCQCALSNKAGTAKLVLKPNSEMNVLSNEDTSALITENVELSTLDRYSKERKCEQIDFIKIDAEGEESNIINGGNNFFDKESPLIMYEIMYGEKPNHSVIRQFAELGYRSYRLLPGLNILAPVDLTETLDPYQLNLFCCKNDRAEFLEKRGVLANLQADTADACESNDQAWRHLLDSKPFAKSMLLFWEQRVTERPRRHWKNLKIALELFAKAHDRRHNPNTRYMALKLSYTQLVTVCNELPTIGRLCTLARASRELGYRTKAMQCIKQALDLYSTRERIVLDEPFLPVLPRFDIVDPENRINDWIFGSLLSAGVTLHSFSSYYSGKNSLRNLEILLGTGFAGSEIERIRQLIRMRYGLQSGPEPSPLLREKKIDNLNPELWR